MAGALWCVGGLAGVAIPAWRDAGGHAMPAARPGPVLRQARAQGVLRVGVRFYPRPAPPGHPAGPEADGLDAALARELGRRAGVPVALVAWPADPAGVDLVVAGADARAGLEAAVARPYARSPGRLTVARGVAMAGSAALHAQPVCVAHGSPLVDVLRRTLHAQPIELASSIHAAAAFMAGDCRALAEDEDVLARWRRQPEWRFYRELDPPLLPTAGARIHLPRRDPASASLLARWVADWQLAGGAEAARKARAAALALELAQVAEGSVCH